uniref:Uncharacterized protein n=1 Tax=Trichogramma kaykai TaxID=54128 RepID=A0ABD2XQE9_9HYME
MEVIESDPSCLDPEANRQPQMQQQQVQVQEQEQLQDQQQQEQEQQQLQEQQPQEQKQEKEKPLRIRPAPRAQPQRDQSLYYFSRSDIKEIMEKVERGWSRQSPLPPDGRLPPDAEPGREDEARSDSLPRLADDLHPRSLRLSAGRRRQPRAVGLRGPLLDQLDAGARGQLSPLGAVRAAPPSAQRSRRRVRGAARAGLVHVAQAAAPTARRSPLRRPEDPGAISRRRGGHRARDRLDPGTDVDPRRRRRGREQQRRRLRHGTTAGLGQHRPDPGAHRGGLPSGGLRLEPRQTLNRADLWPCHLFFKRQPGEVVPSCRFAPGGFNLVPHVSRLLDVAELVQLSTSRNQRRCHEAALLEDYHRALCRALEENQREDSTPLPSLEDVLAEYEAVRVAGLYLAAMHMSLPRRWSSWSRRDPVGGQRRLEHPNVYLRFGVFRRSNDYVWACYRNDPPYRVQLADLCGELVARLAKMTPLLEVSPAELLDAENNLIADADAADADAADAADADAADADAADAADADAADADADADAAGAADDQRQQREE